MCGGGGGGGGGGSGGGGGDEWKKDFCMSFSLGQSSAKTYFLLSRTFSL